MDSKQSPSTCRDGWAKVRRLVVPSYQPGQQYTIGERCGMTEGITATAQAAANWSLVAVTSVLVLTTIYYAWQTHQTVSELRTARGIQVRPRLIPAIEKIGPKDALPRVSNVGVGSALGVNVRLTLEPNGPSAEFHTAFLSPGRGQSLLLPKEAQTMEDLNFISTLDELEAFQSLHLKGECTDALGEEHSIDESFDLSGYIRAFKSGVWARRTTITRTGGDPLDRIADAVVNIEHFMKTDREAD